MLRWCGGFLYALILRAVVRWAPRIEVRGLPVTLAMPRGAERDRKVAMLERALRLIDLNAPRQAAAVRRELAGVVVYDAGPSGLGHFHPRLRLCGINMGCFTAATGDAVIVACVLVHEARHGRLARYGYRGARLRDRRILHRVEGLCVKAELDLAQSLPQSEAFQRILEARLRDVPRLYSQSHERAERRRILAWAFSRERRDGSANDGPDHPT